MGRYRERAIVLTAALLAVCPRCRRQAAPPQPPATTEARPPAEPSPAVAPGEPSRGVEPSAPIARVPTEELRKWLDASARRERAWFHIERIDDGADGGWITGAFAAGNKVVIETRDVRRFVLDLSRIPIDWTRRAVLRVDGSSSELTRRHGSILHLRRTSSGGWSVVHE